MTKPSYTKPIIKWVGGKKNSRSKRNSKTMKNKKMSIKYNNYFLYFMPIDNFIIFQ